MRIRKPLKRFFFTILDPVFRRFRTKRIVMFHNGRSGSALMGLMLDDHPDIYWAGELLKGPRVARYKKLYRDFDYKEVIRKEESHAGPENYGFEMKYMHIRHLGISKEQFLADLDDLGYTHFIVLVRQNILRRETSSRVAAAAGFYHLNHVKTAQLHQITLNTENLIAVLERHSQDVAEIQQLLQTRPFLLLTYEHDIQNDPLIAYNKICAYLEVPAHPVTPKLQRTNPFPLDKIILNFDEVAATLQGTKFEWMLER